MSVELKLEVMGVNSLTLAVELLIKLCLEAIVEHVWLRTSLASAVNSCSSISTSASGRGKCQTSSHLKLETE